MNLIPTSDSDSEPTRSAASASDAPGIVYLSRVPRGFTAKGLVDYFKQFGKIGRFRFLKAKPRPGKKKKNAPLSQGWIEFKSIEVARTVAQSLNAMPVDKSGELWSIIFLDGVVWFDVVKNKIQREATLSGQYKKEFTKAKNTTRSIKNMLEAKRSVGASNAKKVKQKET